MVLCAPLAVLVFMRYYVVNTSKQDLSDTFFPIFSVGFSVVPNALILKDRIIVASRF